MSNGNKFNQLITKISLRFLVLAVTAQIIISFFGAAYCAIKLLSSENDNSLNPVLNEYTDITPEIVNGIISNKFKSITISYEFTRCRKPMNLLKSISITEIHTIRSLWQTIYLL